MTLQAAQWLVWACIVGGLLVQAVAVRDERRKRRNR